MEANDGFTTVIEGLSFHKWEGSPFLFSLIIGVFYLFRKIIC